MHKAQKQVQEFHRVVLDGPTSPAEPRVRNPELRAKLILEEAIETVVALVGGEKARELICEAEMTASTCREEDGDWKQPNLVEAIDGIVDTIYVCYGSAEDVGIDLEPFFDEVHASNMRKCDPNKAQAVSKSPVGKVLKPDGWKPPDIAGILERVRSGEMLLDRVRHFIKAGQKASGKLRYEPSREQKISFVYGNVKLSNPDVTLEMVERVVDEAEKKS